jgi:hypothetical protein
MQSFREAPEEHASRLSMWQRATKGNTLLSSRFGLSGQDWIGSTWQSII